MIFQILLMNFQMLLMNVQLRTPLNVQLRTPLNDRGTSSLVAFSRTTFNLTNDLAIYVIRILILYAALNGVHCV